MATCETCGEDVPVRKLCRECVQCVECCDCDFGDIDDDEWTPSELGEEE